MATVTKPTNPNVFSPTDDNVVSPNENLGRDLGLSPQIDDKGNSIITGKPPRNSQRVYQDQLDAAQKAHPKQAVPDYDKDPMWGLQDKQGDVILPKNVVRTPGFVKETLPDPALQQPDFGWVPNPEDLTPPAHIPFVRTPARAPEIERPDYGYNPQYDEIPRDPAVVRLPGRISPDPVLQPDFGWTPNPEDQTPPAAVASKPNPYKDPYAAPDFALVPDPITNVRPGVSERDPVTGLWWVIGGSGLLAYSDESAVDAANRWNAVVAIITAPTP